MLPGQIIIMHLLVVCSIISCHKTASHWLCSCSGSPRRPRNFLDLQSSFKTALVFLSVFRLSMLLMSSHYSKSLPKFRWPQLLHFDLMWWHCHIRLEEFIKSFDFKHLFFKSIFSQALHLLLFKPNVQLRVEPDTCLILIQTVDPTSIPHSTRCHHSREEHNDTVSQGQTSLRLSNGITKHWGSQSTLNPLNMHFCQAYFM